MPQFIKDRLSHPKNAVVEIIIVIGAAYNFWVTARWQGWDSTDPTVKYGAIVWALLIDGGYFASLFMMRDILYKGQNIKRSIWRWSALIFGAITFSNTLLFNAVNWHPGTVPAGDFGWVGIILAFLVSSGIELVLKAFVPVAALYPLAMVAPIRGQSLAEVREQNAIEYEREDGKLKIDDLKRRRDPKAARREERRAEERLLILLRGELTRAGVRHPERLSDSTVKIQAHAKGIYDPATDEVTPYVPKPVPPFAAVWEVALAHDLVSDEEKEDAEFYRGTSLTSWQDEVRRRVDERGLTPPVTSQAEAAAQIEVSDGTTNTPRSPIEVGVLGLTGGIPPEELDELLAQADQLAPEAWIALVQERYPQAVAHLTPERVQAVVAATRNTLQSFNSLVAQGSDSGQTDPRQSAVAASDAPPAIARKRSYTLAEAAKYCKIPPATFRYWCVDQKRFTCTRPRGKPPYFTYEQLLGVYQETAPERQSRQTKKATLLSYQAPLSTGPSDQNQQAVVGN